MKEMIKDTLMILGVCLVFGIYVMIFTPYPAIDYLKVSEKNEWITKDPKNFAEIKKTVTYYKDQTYPSLASNNQYDLYVTKEPNRPLVIWIHGGQFVTGDKSDARTYGYLLANQGYNVASINYELLPSGQNPLPLIQVNDFMKEIKLKANKYGINLEQLYFAGNGSGGTLAGQYVNLQMNEKYRKQLSFNQELDPAHIKGALFYASPFSIKEFKEKNKLVSSDYLMKRLGWAYFGKVQWEETSVVSDLAWPKMIDHYPPVFLTDGNTLPIFEQSSGSLTKLLERKGIPVTAVHYSKEKSKVSNESLFNFNQPQSKETFIKTLQFLQSQER